MTQQVKQWAVRSLGFGVMLAFPLLCGWPVAAVLALALPALAEASRVTGEQSSFTFCALGLAAGFALTVPAPWLWICLAWCAAGVVLVRVADSEPLHRASAWMAVTAGVICAVLAILGRRYGGAVADGLSWDAVHWLTAQENSTQLLVQAWQSGLARLDASIARVPAINLFGALIMTEDVRLELTHSLRYTLAVTLQQFLPQLAVWWMGITGLVCAALPDMLRRRQGKATMLPPCGQWKLPTEAHRGLTVLLLVGFLPLLWGHAVVALVGRMCMAAFQLAYIVLGLCVMEGVMKRMGMGRIRRRVILLVSVVLASFVPMIIGLMDRVLHFREPRREHNDDNDQGGYDV